MHILNLETLRQKTHLVFPEAEFPDSLCEFLIDIFLSEAGNLVCLIGHSLALALEPLSVCSLNLGTAVVLIVALLPFKGRVFRRRLD